MRTASRAWNSTVTRVEGQIRESKHDRTAQHHKPEASTTSSLPGADADLIGGMNATSPRWFARNIRQFVTVPWDGPEDIARPCVRRRLFRALITHRGSWERPRGDSPRPNAELDRDTLNRCLAFPDAANAGASIDGIPRDAKRSMVAGWTSASASRHRGHNHRKSSQSRRSDGRKRRFERARTLNWWRRARLSSRRSLPVDEADRTAAQVRETSRIARRVAIGDANVNDFARPQYWRGTPVLECL
jgi:hypothetical protein